MIIKSKVLPIPTNERERQLYFIIEELIAELRIALGGGIVVTSNLNGQTKTITTPATPDEFSTSHTLTKIPTGYIVLSQNKTGNLYKGTTSWTSTLCYFQCDTSEVEFKILIF